MDTGHSTRRPRPGRHLRLVLLAALVLTPFMGESAEIDNVRVVIDTQHAQPGQRLISPHVSPDGNVIAYEGTKGNSRFTYLFDRATGTSRRIHVRKTLFSASSSYDSELDWCMADGCRGAFVLVSGKENNLDLFAGRLGDEGVPRKLTTSRSADYQPRFAPHRADLLFLSGRDRVAGTDLYMLRFAQADAGDGGTIFRLTRFDGGVLYPEWSPDGKAIVFSGARSPEAGGTSSYDVWALDVAAIDQAIERASKEAGATDLSSVLTPTNLTRSASTDDLAPSVDSASRFVAFYRSEASLATGKGNQRDEKPQSLVVVALDRGAGGIRASGDARVLLRPVADPNEDHQLRGPVWLGGTTHLITVRDDPKAFNPIVVVEASTGTVVSEMGRTKMNCDLTAPAVGPDGAAGHTFLYSAHKEQSTAIYEGTFRP